MTACCIFLFYMKILNCSDRLSGGGLSIFKLPGSEMDFCELNELIPKSIVGS